MNKLLALSVLILCGGMAPDYAHGDDATPTLAPIVKEGTPADVLIEDPVLPVQQGSPTLNNGSGNIDHSLTDQMALQLRDTGRPGVVSQFRGLGVTALDNNVQALGIPLNGAQGTGFDFSLFPQFMWANYRFQLGPSMGALDGGAISGTLTLVPWTEQALVDHRPSSRATAFVSDQNLGQVSAAKSDGDLYAVDVGYSVGDAQGPSGEASTQFRLGTTDGKLHLLATDVKGSGRVFSPSNPNFSETTVRVLPVLQFDTPLATGTTLKNSFFYDNEYFRSDDPVYGSSRSRAYQYGTENVLLTDDWKLGASGRWLQYSGTSFAAAQEGVATFQVTRLLVSGNVLVDPTVTAIGVSEFGFYPEASLGGRAEFESGKLAVFARGNYNRKFPTLNDRIGSLPGYFIPNPLLGVETDITGTVGAEWKGERRTSSLQFFIQGRQNAEVFTTLSNGFLHQYQNLGDARIFSILHNSTWDLGDGFDLANSWTFSSSNIQATGLRFLYLPDFLDVASLGFSAKPVSLRLYGRFATDSEGGIPGSGTYTLAGYGLYDFEARASLDAKEKFSLSGRVDNLTNRPAEIIRGSPLVGRTVSVLLVGTL